MNSPIFIYCYRNFLTFTFVYSSKLTQRLGNVHLAPNKLPRPPELLFSWGVYFSGLIPLAPLAIAKCRANCLIFQLNGENFTSPALISEQGLHNQLRLHYQRYADQDNNEHSAETHGDDNGINSPNVSRSNSPVLQMSIMRYSQLGCQLADMRQSYSLDKLLLLQRLQRDQHKKLRDVEEISGEIARLSVRCITHNELRLKPRTTSVSGSQHSQHYHSMGRTLSVLLAEQQQIAPLTLYTAQQLMQHIETLRWKQRLLQAERETFKERCTQKHERLKILRTQRDEIRCKYHNQLLQLEQQRLKFRTEASSQQTEQKRQIILQVIKKPSKKVEIISD